MRQAQDDEIHLEGQKREQLNCFASAKQFDVMLLQAEREEVSMKMEQDAAIDLTYKDSAWSKSPVFILKVPRAVLIPTFHLLK